MMIDRVMRLTIGACTVALCLQETGAAVGHMTGAPSAFTVGFGAEARRGGTAIAFGGRGGGRGRGQFGGGGVRPEQKVVEQFDRDADKRLSAAERRAARIWLESNGASSGRGGGGRGQFRGTPEPGPRLMPADVQSYPAGGLYDTAVLRTMFLRFDEEDWEQELMTFYNTDVDVPATLTMDGKVYKEVGVHFRGNSSYRMVPKGYKHSFNLSFDFAHDNQDIDGYHGTNLLNANNDPTFLRTVLFSEIGQSYVPIAKANYMRVAINGESWGIYTNTEQVKQDFLREHFGTTKGARWKVPGSPGGRAGLNYLGEAVEPYKRLYEIKSKDDPKAWADFINLCRVLDTTPASGLAAALAPIFDVDGALKFIALDVVLSNTDGYWTRASDYNVYQDPTGKFHVFPHDFNEGLGVEEGRGFGGGGVELDPLVGLNDAGKPLRSRLLAVPALRARYLTYVRDIAQKQLDWKKLGPMAAQFQSLIRADVLSDTHKLYGSDQFEPDAVHAFVEARRAFLLSSTTPAGGSRGLNRPKPY